MKAIEAYQDVLRELDAWKSPPFPIRSFNYFYNEAISQYIADNYAQLGIRLKEDDDLRSVIILEQPASVDGSTNFVNLPTDYRHFLGAKVKLKFLVAAGKYKKDELRFHYIERTSSAEKARKSHNAYGRSAWNNVTYQIAGSTIKLEVGSKVVFPAGDNMWIDYIKIPPVVYLNPDKSSDYNLEGNNSTLFFNIATSRNHVYYEISKQCARMFAENTRNPRFQSMSQSQSNE